MTESFLEGMKGLFEEHYVTIPEEKYDVLESMVEKLDDMETKLNEQIEKNISSELQTLMSLLQKVSLMKFLKDSRLLRRRSSPHFPKV